LWAGHVRRSIEITADVPESGAGFLTGKTFDNGTICASIQSFVVDAPIEKAVATVQTVRVGLSLAWEADQWLKIVVTRPAFPFDPGIVRRSVDNRKEAGPPMYLLARACLMQISWRRTRLSAFNNGTALRRYSLLYVVDGIEQASARFFENLFMAAWATHRWFQPAPAKLNQVCSQCPASRVTVKPYNAWRLVFRPPAAYP